MNLPNEVTLMVLAHLPKRDLKQARLVCKDLASLGASILVGTLYISPRETDMVVFDAITQHPTIRHSVKHLFYDTAQFKKQTTRQYLRRLQEQFTSLDFNNIREQNIEVQQVIKHIEKSARCSLSNLYKRSKSIINQCWRHPALSDGFQHYALLADQHHHILSQSWFSRVVQGLGAIGRIHAVTIGNSFDPRNGPKICIDPSQKVDESYQVEDVTGGNDYPGYDGNRDNRTGHTSFVLLSLADMIIGRRSVGSPVARQWPFTSLQPASTRIFDGARAVKPEESIAHGRSEGSHEFLQLMQLLALTKKQPAFLSIMASRRFEAGLPSSIFGRVWPGHIRSLGDYKGLRVLRLKFGFCHFDYTGPRDLQFHLLKPIFHNMSLLEELSLHLPFYPFLREDVHNNFLQVFPPTTKWRLEKLHSLSLYGLSTSYSDLIGTLFLSLPNLKHLRLGAIRLIDGNWGDIIEGLRDAKNLLSCEFSFWLKGEIGPFPSFGKEELESLSEYVLHRRDYPIASSRCVPTSFLEGLERLQMTVRELRLSHEQERQGNDVDVL